MKTSITKLISGLALACVVFVANVSAQDVLPRPDPKFKGVIGQTYKDSTPGQNPPHQGT